MQVDVSDFIGVFKGAYSPNFCKTVISKFEAASNGGFTHTYRNDEHTETIEKDDEHLFLPEEIPATATGIVCQELTRVFWDECYPKYIEEYPSIKRLQSHNSYYAKIQKTKPGQGYHIWHCEQDSRAFSQRLMAWIVYLNDVEEGGETEFLYQKRRVKAEEGTLLLFPAAYTHTHRGNPPLSNTKYIATGWVEF